VQIHLYLLTGRPLALEKAAIQDMTLASNASIWASIFVPELGRTLIASKHLTELKMTEQSKGFFVKASRKLV
jgi:hypothetical protein